MYSPLTNIDEIELSNTFDKTRIELDEHEPKYADVEWVALDDKNSGIYKQEIRFDTTDLKDKLPVYREGYVQFPIKATSSNVAYTAASKLAFKCSVLSLVNTLSIRPAGSGPALVNDINGQLPLINNLRLLTASDVDWIECTGSELHFFGCDRSVTANAMGVANHALTPVSSYVSVAVPSHDAYSNERLANRVTIFSAQSDRSDPTKFQMIVCIPNKYLHSFLDQLSYPLPNYPMKFAFGLASITNGSSFMPITTPSVSVPVTTVNGTVTPVVQVTIPPVDVPVLSIDTSVTAFGPAIGACRMIVKCVTLNDTDRAKMDAKLASGYKKTITYLSSDLHPFDAVPTTALGKRYHKVFGENTMRPARVWAMFPPTGALTSTLSTFPAIMGPVKLTNCNLKINGKDLRHTPFQSQYELYQPLREYQLGSSYRQIQGAPISYNDFCYGMNPQLFDMHRHPTVLNNLPITFTFDADMYSAGATTCDAIFIVERYQTAFIDITNSKAETDVKDGIHKRD